MTATVRSVRVVLNAEIAKYVADMKLAGRVTQDAFSGAGRSSSEVQRAMGDVEKSTTKAGTAARKAGQDFDNLGGKARGAGREIDRMSGRIGLLIKAGVTLGPALIPIGAVALPAITSLTGGVGALAGGVGVAVLAFHGLGDALKAVDAYQLEPTDANLKKLRDTLGELSPAAQQLVMRLDSLEPVLTRLRTSAQNGLFPGVNDGIDEMLTLLPEVRTVVSRLAIEMGNLAAGAGQSLSHDADWQAFFHFIETDAVPTMDAFARATGNFVAGAASILVAFRPLSNSFSQGLLDMSRGFREWAANLSSSDGFQSFVDYIRQNGPAVAAFFKATAQALVALVQAAAPWGSAVLPILTEAAQVFATIGGSPIGPVLYDAAAAMLVFNRASALFGTNIPKIGAGITSTRTSLATLKADLGTMAATWATAGAQSERESARMAAAQTRVANTAGKLGGALKAAAGVGGIMLFADGMSRTNKTIGTLETTLGGAAAGFAAGGPWGAAVGGAIGLVLSLGRSHEDAAKQVADLTGTFDVQTGAITENTRAAVANDLQKKGLLDAAEQLGISSAMVTDAVLGNVDAQTQLNSVLGNYDVDHTITSVDDLSKSFSAQEVSTILADRAATKLRDTLPGVTDAFGGQAAQAKQLGRAMSGDYSDGVHIATKSTEELKREQVAEAKAMAQARQAARQTAQSFTAFGSSLNDSKVSLNSWIHSMAEQAKALRNFTNNARTAAKRGLRDGLIHELEAAGPAGALRMKQLANASNTEIGRANKAWASGRRAIQAYVNLRVPPKRVTVDTSQAASAISNINARLAGIHDKTVRIKVESFNSKIAGMKQQAEGGTVEGPRQPYGDKVVTMLAPGEEVISNRHGQADRFRADRAAGRIPGYANGGTVRNPNSQLFGLGMKNWSDAEIGGRISNLTVKQIHRLGDEMDHLGAKNLTRLGKALDKATNLQEKQTEAAQQAYDDVQQRRAGYASNYTQALTRDLWGGNGNTSAFTGGFAANSIGGATQQLNMQTQDAKDMQRLEKILRERGVHGGALDEILSGGIDRVRSAASQSAGALRDYETAYDTSQRYTASAANTGAALLTPEFGKLRAEAVKQTSELQAIHTESHLLVVEQRQRHQQNQAAARARRNAARPARRG